MNLRAFAISRPVPAGKAPFVIAACLSAYSSSWSPAAIASNKARAVVRNAASGSPLAAYATACAAKVPSGKISMPVAGIPMLIAVSTVVPAPENGSNTCVPCPRSMNWRTSAVENPSLYFSQRSPTAPLFPWYDTNLRLSCELTCSRRAKRRCRSARAEPLWSARGAGATSLWNKVCIPNRRVRPLVIHNTNTPLV